MSKGKEQIIALKIVDKNGKEVYATQYVKVEVGKTRKITLPKFSGYYPKNKNYNMTLKGTHRKVIQYRKLYIQEQQRDLRSVIITE